MKTMSSCITNNIDIVTKNGFVFFPFESHELCNNLWTEVYELIHTVAWIQNLKGRG